LNIQKISHFFGYELWRFRLERLSRKKSFFIKQLRIIVLAFRGFDEDKCSLRASALTFYSLISIVPAAALGFGIAKGFGMQQRLEKEIVEKMKGQEEVVNYVIAFANSMLEDAKGGIIAGIGIVTLFYFIIKLLGNIEKSFNDIWGIQQTRSLGRKLGDYLSILFVAPILLIMSSSLTVFIATQVTQITQKIAILGPVSPLILFSLKFLPYCVIWLLFTFVYMFMPNTKVHFKSGLSGGIVAGTIFVIVQWIYITFQIVVTKYGAIYGSFAVLPLFMIWLQISWYIVLFGAEITFAHQNVDTYAFEPDSLSVSHSFKRLLALRIAHLCIRNFTVGEPPLSAGDISNTLEIPIRLTNQILYELVQCRILSETVGEDERDPLYQPARNVDTLSIGYIIKALDRIGTEELTFVHSEATRRISESIKEFNHIIEQSKANLLLKDIP